MRARVRVCVTCRVCGLLYRDGGSVFVCGDGQSMAADVHAALRRATQAHLRVSAEAAEAKLADLSDQGRYCREIWN